MTDPPPEPSPRSARGAFVVLAVVGLITVAMGAVFAVRLMRSEEALWAAEVRMKAAGPSLTVDQCVDGVMTWRAGCSALETLCDQTVDPMIDTCLKGADRTGYCSTVREWTGNTGFEFAQCDERGVQEYTPVKGFWDRMLFGGGRLTPARKACAKAYRAVAEYCEGRTVVEIL